MRFINQNVLKGLSADQHKNKVITILPYSDSFIIRSFMFSIEKKIYSLDETIYVYIYI